MKRNRFFSLLSAISLIVAGGCSDDTLNQGTNNGSQPTDPTGGVYMTVDIKMPTGAQGTRSSTIDGGGSTGGTEVGTDAENTVTNALIVLTAAQEIAANGDLPAIDKYGFIVAGEVQSNRITNLSEGNSKQYRATANLNKDNLNTFYGRFQASENKEVCVFVFCNPTRQLTDMFANGEVKFGSSAWLNSTCQVIQGIGNGATDQNLGIWGTNSFLMNNVELATRLLPLGIQEWENYTSVEKPFHLSNDNQGSVNNSSTAEPTPRGSIKVERSIARFDFRDGSPYGNLEGDAKLPNTYPVIYLTNEEGNIDKSKPIIDIELQKMCLVNMSKEFYYLPRVSNNGLPTGADFEICGREKAWTRENSIYVGGNYLVGPNADAFGGTAILKGFSTYFNYPFFEDNGSFNNEEMSATRWDVVKIENVLKGRDDQYVGEGNTENNTTHKAGDYKVWRYVTENVIPNGPGTQLNGISTGVVFKGKLLGDAVAQSADLYEEYWNKGYIKNLADCLNGNAFTYNGETHPKLTGNSKDDPILYYFNGRLYMGWRHIRQAAIQASITENVNGDLEINRATSLYKAVFGDGPIPPNFSTDKDGNEIQTPLVFVNKAGVNKDINDPTWTTDTESEVYKLYIQSANYAWSQWAKGGKEIADEATGLNAPESLQKMRAAVTGAGIYIYQSSMDSDYGPGYYCYYYYWNRHNDNGLNGTMAPMEFSVVRNNVYKLSVDQISRIGHPRIPENDPNNPKPEDPDESDKIYLDVQVQIVPWVVRLNKIEF